ncbi:MAG: hypothetical protein EBT91_02170 [Rhodobacteraceae bacterium]|nr:hypothetical protein [Paracoccaceae bacterium]
MTAHAFSLCDTALRALPSGALHIPGEEALCVSDLHLGKSDRIARRGGGLLPPYEARETLARLEADILATDARQVICLGDSFDDLAAQDSLGEAERLWLARLRSRLILPAYGTYTGGLSSTDPIFAELLKRPAIAVLTGTRAIPTPL